MRMMHWHRHAVQVLFDAWCIQAPWSLTTVPLTGSVCAVPEVVEYAAGIAPQMMGEYVEHVATGMDTYSIRQPLGVRATACLSA